MQRISPFDTVMHPEYAPASDYQHFPADAFPSIHPVHWLHSHFAVGGWSPLKRLSGMLTAHMTRIAPQNGFTWHPHRGLEIYTWVLEGRVYHEDTTGGKGVIEAGELQRMFSGEWIEHQELNNWDDPARVIQIWFAADPIYQDLEPHYQQVRKSELPIRTVGDATVYSLINDDSPMDSHVSARLTAAAVPANSQTTIEPPRVGEDLFLYVTDGSGHALRQNDVDSHSQVLGQYDVILARPSLTETTLTAGPDGLHFMSFYLPSFLPA